MPHERIRDHFEYVPVSDADRKWGIHLVASGFQKVPGNSKYPRVQLRGFPWTWATGRILDEFAIVFIRRGRGIFESKGGRRKKVEEGNVLLLLPGVWHRYRPDLRTGWEEHWVVFDGEIPRRLVENGAISAERPVLDPGRRETLMLLFSGLEDEVRNRPVGHARTAAALTFQILVQIDAGMRSKGLGGNPIEKKIRKAQALMADRLERRLSMPELARSLSVGYSWFRRKFREYTGHSPAQYHLKLRLNRARQLLLGTDLPLKEIADRTGFHSAYHFSRAFKAEVGRSPSAFRT